MDIVPISPTPRRAECSSDRSRRSCREWTDPEEPARTVTSPECVSTSRSTGPLTCRVLLEGALRRGRSETVWSKKHDQRGAIDCNRLDTRLDCGECVSYSYRSDSTGVISAARWAGYMPAVTVINESVKIEAIIEIHETMGCGTKSGSGKASIAAQVPIPKESPRMPLTIVSMADSAKTAAGCRAWSRPWPCACRSRACARSPKPA
jgi:hypothetical protein